MDRREFIIANAVGATTILAGCASGDTSSGDDTGQVDDTSDDSDSEGSTDGNGDETDTDDDEPEETDDDTDDEPDDEPEEIEEIDPQSFDGSGDDVIDGVSIEGGLTVVDATHSSGERNFQVRLVDDSEFDEHFVNHIGEYDGQTAELVEMGEYMLEVNADGEWEIEVQQPVPNDVESLPQELSGEGNRVFGPFDFDGTHTADGEHNGERNFQVSVYPEVGDFSEGVFNEIGEYDGSTTFSHDGPGWVGIVADGEWSVSLE
ncbi:hypothetical protein [Natrialba sp. INN-245]|uniref:hypothetical protein n=1 Tax=Natrialba sp. INN-245 TaxID=2690967 RepID=UPI0013124356|nr:hypothetical protein [Natrialba sp. INN-245]MWV40126.1 hypothetical protein [Natrialba sp. INN-245]